MCSLRTFEEFREVPLVGFRSQQTWHGLLQQSVQWVGIFSIHLDLAEDRKRHSVVFMREIENFAIAAGVLFSKLDTPEAAFSEGMARIRNREYRPAIKAFETALERNPGWPEAQHNLEVSRAILEEVESAREQSDTGEEAGIGADDIVFDNENGRGAETTVQAQDGDAAPLSADQWISSIDTDMGDFLKSRFILENQEQHQ